MYRYRIGIEDAGLKSSMYTCKVTNDEQQVDKTQPYNDNKKLINVFETDSINIVSGVSFNG